MVYETQLKTAFLLPFINKIVLITIVLTLSACSFVELLPGAEQIIYSNHKESCQKISEFHAKVNTENFLIERRAKAISNELRILAQNEAFEKKGNAIWPSSEISNGQQDFDIFYCKKR